MFEKGQPGVPGPAGWSKNLPGSSPGLKGHLWQTSRLRHSSGQGGRGSIGEGFEHSDRNQNVCLSTRLCHQRPLRRGKSSHVSKPRVCLSIEADGEGEVTLRLLGTSEVPTWSTAAVPGVQAAVRRVDRSHAGSTEPGYGEPAEGWHGQESGTLAVCRQVSNTTDPNNCPWGTPYLPCQGV